jgi:hypothetical protein
LTEGKDAGEILTGKRHQDVVASFSCQEGCHCTP